MNNIEQETSFNDVVKALETQFFPENKEETADTQKDSTEITPEDGELDEENPQTEEEAEKEEAEDESVDTFEVNIDGTPKKVTLDELKNGYLRQSSYTKKTTEVAEQRKEIETLKTTQEKEIQELVRAKTAYVEKLTEAEQALSTTPNYDWARLADENPDLFVKLKYEDEIRVKALHAAKAAKEQVQQELFHQQEQQVESCLKKEHDLLKDRAPEFGDATKATEIWDTIGKVFKDEGFTKDQVLSLALNHKAMLLVRDGVLYRNLQQKASGVKEKKVNPSTKPLRSGNGDSIAQEKSQTYRAAHAKAVKTGNLRDVAQLFNIT